MKNLKLILMVLIAGFSLSGCLTATAPIHTPETLISEPGLAGTWVGMEKGSERDDPAAVAANHPSSVYRFLEEPGQAYLTVTFEGALFQVYPVRLGPWLYLDITPDPEDLRRKGKSLTETGHFIFHYELSGDTLKLYIPDLDRLESRAREAGIRLEASRDFIRGLTLYGTTDQLQVLFAGIPVEAFGEPAVMKRWVGK
jgi:hypothetical protein